METLHTFTATADQGLGRPHAALVADGNGGWYGVGYVGEAETLFQLVTRRAGGDGLRGPVAVVRERRVARRPAS